MQEDITKKSNQPDLIARTNDLQILFPSYALKEQEQALIGRKMTKGSLVALVLCMLLVWLSYVAGDFGIVFIFGLFAFFSFCSFLAGLTMGIDAQDTLAQPFTASLLNQINKYNSDLIDFQKLIRICSISDKLDANFIHSAGIRIKVFESRYNELQDLIQDYKKLNDISTKNERFQYPTMYHQTIGSTGELRSAMKERMEEIGLLVEASVSMPSAAEILLDD